MKKDEKKQLKETIEAKILELESRLKELYEATKPMGLDSAIGRLSRMDYINNKAIDEVNIKKSEANLSALRKWLSIYDTDRFGKCTKCGNEINIQRLLLLPESSRCINCAGR